MRVMASMRAVIVAAVLAVMVLSRACTVVSCIVSGRRGKRRWHSAGQQIVEQLAHWTDVASKRQRLAAPKEQPLFGIAALRGGELGFDTELTGARITILEAAVRQTFELARTLTALGTRLGAQFLFLRQIALQPRR